jgi:hypothetical protein
MSAHTAWSRLRGLLGLGWHAELAGIAAAANVPAGGAALAAYGAGHAAFVGVLYLSGEAPSRAPFGLPAERWYLWEAGFLVPALLLSWAIWGAVASAVGGRLGGRATPAGRPSMLAVLGWTTSVPLGVAFLVPDVVAWCVGGMDAVRWVLPVSGTIAVLWTLCWSISGARMALGLGRARAAFATLVGLVVASPITTLIR